MARVENYWPQPAEGANGRTSIKIDLAEGDRTEEATGKGRRFLTRAAFAVLLLAMFGSLLYGTSVYLRSADPFGGFPSIFSSGTTAKATTDVNLRAGPSANSELIGLVTRDSRVRILRTRRDVARGYVLEQGRQAADQTNVGRLVERTLRRYGMIGRILSEDIRFEHFEQGQNLIDGDSAELVLEQALVTLGKAAFTVRGIHRKDSTSCRVRDAERNAAIAAGNRDNTY